MKDLIKNKYFYIGLIISAFTVLGVSTITFKALKYIEPSLDSYIDKEFITKSTNYINKIQIVCQSTPDKEYLLVSFVGSTMEIITKVDCYNKWSDTYRDKLERSIKLTLMRGGYNLALIPLEKGKDKEKGSLVIK
jgi:hypothetical protein